MQTRMAELTRALSALALVGGLVACGAGAREDTPEQTAPAPSTPVQKATASPANPDSAILADFNARLDNYVKVQRALLKRVRQKETEDPAEITARQQVLAGQLKHIRSNAKQGDIFTPQVAAMFKRLMYPELKGAEGRETKNEIKEEAPAVELKVNATYPSSQPLTTVPPNLLANLPQLPKDVEYRFVGKHLILRDVDANMIVDYMYNAIR
jgi:hypothetical protein